MGRTYIAHPTGFGAYCCFNSMDRIFRCYGNGWTLTRPLHFLAPNTLYNQFMNHYLCHWGDLVYTISNSVLAWNLLIINFHNTIDAVEEFCINHFICLSSTVVAIDVFATVTAYRVDIMTEIHAEVINVYDILEAYSIGTKHTAHIDTYILVTLLCI